MARTPSLVSMSIEQLLKLRDDVEKTLSQKAVQLEDQLSRLGGDVGAGRRGRPPGRRSAMKGRKVPIKYRDKEGNTWAGRGAQPRWLRDKLKDGAKIEDFAVEKTAASRKASPRKYKKRRKAKR
jgi:DNA-binding protein H-NS